MPESSSSKATAESSDRGGSRLGRILLPITRVIAMLGAALSGWLWYRQAHEGTVNTPNYTDAQRADAKQKICATMDLVREGVSLNTNLQPPGGPEDVTSTLAVAA